MSNQLKGKRVSESVTVSTEMIMPNDTNPLGNLMGGNLMRWMDIIGGVCASKHTNAYVVTVSVDYVSFKKPIHNGDVITLKACVTRAFNTSVEVYVEVFAADMKNENPRKSNDAYLTFVAVDENTKKLLKVPPVIPLTDSEQKRYESAVRRREVRLVLAGRLDPKDAKELKAFFSV